MTPYTVELKPGANVDAAASRLAKLIIDRWMPGNAGGVHILLTPRLAGSLASLWAAVNASNKSKRFRVSIEGNKPLLTEMEEA